MDKGKYLESKLQKYFKSKNIWFLRLYDTRSAGMYIPAQPSDYIIIKKNPEFLECKEMEKLRLDISDFQPSQLKAMQRAKLNKIKYSIIILVKKKQYYLLDSSDIFNVINNKQKSISLKNRQFTNKIDDLCI